jgi:hypothetical protein
MMHLGSPEGWLGFIDTRIPDILSLVIEAWESLPPPAANELEDPVSESLCRALRRARDRCDLPFQVHPQLVELDPAAGQDQGRMDIVFLPPATREDIYFCLECKRLNVREGSTIRPYHAEYVKFGMLRFVRGQYANSVHFGGMLAFVLNADLPHAIAGIEANIRTLCAELGMEAPGAFRPSSVRPDDARIRETWHRREDRTDPLVIHHLFMAGDPTAPSRPEPLRGARAKKSTKKRKLE